MSQSGSAPHFERAVQYSERKHPHDRDRLDDHFQGLALLAVAEAIHRLADAVSQQPR